MMAHRAEETQFAPTGRDDAADASRFFSRVGYAALAIGAPVGVVVHPLALFIVFPIGVALIVMAAGLGGKPGFTGRAVARSRRRRFWRSSPASPGRPCRSSGRPIRYRRYSTR